MIFRSKDHTSTITGERYNQGLVMLHLIRLLCGNGVTFHQIAKELNVTTRTARRLVGALERFNIPVYIEGGERCSRYDQAVLKCDREFLRRFFRV